MTVGDLRLRARVLRRRTRLDAALADGAPPDDDPALALRARQLASAPTRRSIANAIHNLVEAAEEPPDAWPRDGPQPPLQCQAVRAAEAELRTVADRLQEPGEVDPQALALAALLVWDVGSPIYSTRDDTSILEWVDAVLELTSEARAAGIPRPGR